MRRFLSVVLASVYMAACGGGGDGGTTAPPAPVATVLVTLASTAVVTGTPTSATAAPRDSRGNALTGRTVTWTSSVPSVATVDGSGLITPLAPGVTSIAATSEGQSGTATLTVLPPPIATVVFSGTARMKVGDNYVFTATARSADGTVVNRPITWNVKESGRGTVTAGGVLTPLQAGSFTLQAIIDGTIWESTYSAYDWVALSGSGNTFLSLDADNLITNKFGSSEYAQLVFACSAAGNFFVWVQTSRFVTQSGLVTYSFDSGAPTSTFWTESSDFSTLFRPGNNGVSKTFAAQMAASRLFIFVFSEFNATAKGSTFRVTGLSSKITTLYGLCPSNAISAPSNAGTIASIVRDSTRTMDAASSTRSEADRLQRSASNVSVGPTQAAEQARMLLTPENATGVTAGTSVQPAVKRRF